MQSYIKNISNIDYYYKYFISWIVRFLQIWHFEWKNTSNDSDETHVTFKGPLTPVKSIPQMFHIDFNFGERRPTNLSRL